MSDEEEEQNVINREDDEPAALNYDSDEEYGVEGAEPLEDSGDDDIVSDYVPLEEQEQQQQQQQQQQEVGVEGLASLAAEPLEEVGVEGLASLAEEPLTPPPPPAPIVPPPIQRQGVIIPLESDSESSTDDSDELVAEPHIQDPEENQFVPHQFVPQGFTAETFDATILDTIEWLNISNITHTLSGELETLYNSPERAEERKQSLKLLTDSINGTSKHTVFVNLNLCGADLFNLKLTQLSRFTFINCVFINAKIAGANMRKTAFYNCLAHKVDISVADLSKAYIYQCDFLEANFIDSIMMDMFCMRDILDYMQEDYPIINKLIEEGFIDHIVPGNASNFMNKCHFEQAILNGTELSNIDFTESNFNNASLRQTTCIGTNFTKALMKEADFTSANCLKTNFTQAVGQQICFNNTYLQEAKCNEVKFRHADFRRSTLSQANFSDAKLDRSIFSNCKANSIDFSSTSLRECYFMHSSFEIIGSVNSEFFDTKLTGSIFKNCKLKNAGFSEANCCDVKFIKCDFTEAKFDDAYLHKVMFEGCNMEGVVLDRAFIDPELLLNLRITGVIPLEWPAPTDPIPDEALFCILSDERAPDFATLTDYDEGAPIALPEPNTESSAESEGPATSAHVSAAAYLADQFYWNPQLEANPTVILQAVQQGEIEEEAEDVFTDAAGNRVRLPDEIDYNEAANIVQHNDFPPSTRFMNFREKDFDGIDFSGKDLTGSSFFGCKLQEAKFVGCNLKDVNFQWADLINTDFTNAQFEGDYTAGGLLEGATILFCNFDGATFNGEDKSSDFNEETVVQPYDPKPYPSSADLVLPEGVPETINSNGLGFNQKDNVTARIKDYVDADELNLVFRVVDVGGAYKDYLIDDDYITQFLENDKSTVYPCRKQFNIPGPSYPGPNQTTYHDIERPIINVGNMIGRRLFVLKDKFKDALDYNAELEPGESKKGFIFYKDANSETVPTFVSHPVLFNNESWVGNLHCNSGAEREALWYVKIVDVVEGSEGAPPPAVQAHDGSEGLAPGVEGEYPLNDDAEQVGSPQAFQGTYVDPFGDDSDSEGSAAPAVEVVYNPPDPVNFETVTIPPPAPLDVNTATGLNIRMNPQNGTMSIINSPVKVSEPLAQATTSIIIAIQKEASNDFTNYIVKINDVITLLKLNKKDAVPCKTNQPIELVNGRRLINIGALLGLIPLPRPIYIDKRQLIRLLPSGSAVKAAKRLRSFVLQYNSESEILPGAKAFVSVNGAECQGPIKIWDFQAWPNNIVTPVIPMEPGDEVTVTTDINHLIRQGVIVDTPLLDQHYYNGLNGYMGQLANPLTVTHEDINGWQDMLGTSAYFVMLYPEDDEPPETPYPILTDINNINRVEEGAVDGAVEGEGRFPPQAVEAALPASPPQAVEAAPPAGELLPVGTPVNVTYTDDQGETLNYTGTIALAPQWIEDTPAYYYEISALRDIDRIEIAHAMVDADWNIGTANYFVRLDSGSDIEHIGDTPVLVPMNEVTPIDEEAATVARYEGYLPQSSEEQNYSPHSPAGPPPEAEQAGGGSKFKTLKRRHHNFRRHTLRRNAENDEAHINRTRHHYKFKKYNQLSKRIKHAL